MRFNEKAIRELILDALNEDELILLCDDQFPEVRALWSSSTSWQMKVRELVAYCGRQERLEELLEQIQAKNPKKYEKYHEKQESSPSSSLLDEVREKASEFEEAPERPGDAEAVHYSAPGGEPSQDEEQAATDEEEFVCWLLTGTVQYNIAAIHDLVREALLPREIRSFCRDRPAFAPVLAHFAPDSGFNDMIDLLLDYCRTRLLFPDLLAEIREYNERQFERHQAQLLAAGEP